ncbi:MAG: hypothetical protein R3F28_12270 [Candidatus Kapaibacterium sp.]
MIPHISFNKNIYANACIALIISIMISIPGCDGKNNFEGKETARKNTSLCNDVLNSTMVQDSNFASFEFLNGYWAWSSTLRCKQGGTLYTDSLLNIAKDTYLCVNYPMVRFSTINSFGIEIYEYGRLDSLRWREKIPKGHDRRLKTTGLECNFHMDRDSVASFTIQLPNAEYVFEYIDDDTIGFFYDSYFFVLAKMK